MNRREFLRASAALAATTLFPSSALLIPSVARANVDTSDFWTRDRTLWVRRLVNRRVIDQARVTYWSQGVVDVNNYVRLCYLLRDVEENQTVMMDVNLFNLMYGLQYWNDLEVGHPTPYDITSGQRMPAHNARIENAAWDSEHIKGKAADGAIPGLSPQQLADRASFFGFGGVGVYLTHTHIDTGRVRKWDGTKAQLKSNSRQAPAFTPKLSK